VLALLCAAHAGLALLSLAHTASTYDEPAHLAAGYAYWLGGNRDLNPEHPPLAKLLAAAPLLARPVRFDLQDPAYRERRQWELGHRFLYAWNDGTRLLTLARLPMIGLSTALVAAIFVWTRLTFGVPAAGVAGTLAAFDPNLIAHGRLVTTDVPLALFTFLTAAAVHRLGERFSWRGAAACGLLVGALVSTKYTGIVVGALFLALLSVLVPGPWRRRLGMLALVLAIALGVLWVSYGFRHGAGQPLDWALVAGPDAGSGALGALRRLGVVPETWLFGGVLIRNMTAVKPSFLLGHTSLEGSWSYFPVVALLKTPLPTLLLAVLAALAWPRHRKPWRAEAVWALPALGYLAFVMTSSFNVGARHILPALPFLLVFAGRAAGLGWPQEAGGTASRRDPRLYRVLLLLLLAWHVAGTLRHHPYHLAFVNELGGGPRNAYLLVGDSNLDWGQDMAGLGAALREHGIPRVKLSYFGSADPDYHGVPYDPLPSVVPGRTLGPLQGVRPGDMVAISATNLQALYLGPEAQDLVLALRRLRPMGHVGYSILLYRSDFTWDPPASR
jgi:hypothetical protein